MTAAICATLAVLLCAAFAAAWPLLGHLDNRLGDDMLAHPRPALSQRVQRWLGLDHIHRQLRGIEADMAKVIDLFNGLVAQQTAASAAQASSFHNIDVSFQKLRDAIANGDATPEVQAAADELSKGFASLQKAAEDEGTLYAPADDPTDPTGGDTPAQPPADGGDTPPVDGGDTADVPVVEKTKR